MHFKTLIPACTCTHTYAHIHTHTHTHMHTHMHTPHAHTHTHKHNVIFTCFVCNTIIFIHVTLIIIHTVNSLSNCSLVFISFIFLRRFLISIRLDVSSSSTAKLLTYEFSSSLFSAELLSCTCISFSALTFTLT